MSAANWSLQCAWISTDVFLSRFVDQQRVIDNWFLKCSLNIRYFNKSSVQKRVNIKDLMHSPQILAISPNQIIYDERKRNMLSYIVKLAYPWQTCKWLSSVVKLIGNAAEYTISIQLIYLANWYSFNALSMFLLSPLPLAFYR